MCGLGSPTSGIVLRCVRLIAWAAVWTLLQLAKDGEHRHSAAHGLLFSIIKFDGIVFFGCSSPHLRRTGWQAGEARVPELCLGAVTFTLLDPTDMVQRPMGTSPAAGCYVVAFSKVSGLEGSISRRKSTKSPPSKRVGCSDAGWIPNLGLRRRQYHRLASSFAGL